MLIRFSDAGEIVPIPAQVAFWHPENYSEMTPGVTSDPPQFLTCLKATKPGDRQIIWQGRDGGGLTAVVDFGEPLRRREGGLYYRWGCITTLDPGLSYAEVADNAILGPRLTGNGGRALQGKPIRLTEEQGLEIDALTNLPTFFGPLRDADGVEISEELEGWGPLGGLDPEALIEAAVARDADLWRAIGFPEAPATQSRLPSSRRPDLLSPGVVGDAKRVVRLTDGPEQIERYIAELNETQPENAPWRGVLIQTVRELDERTTDRIKSSDYNIQVWAVTPTSFGRLAAERIV